MSSLRSSRGYSSITLDRLRYGSGSGPGVLAVGINGVVGPTGTANLQTLNVIGTATIDTAVIDTLIIDDVDFRTVSAIDFQTQTLEVSGTGTINQLTVGGLTVGGLTGGTGTFGYLSVNGFTGGTGAFHDITVDRLHINEYINDVNHVSTISADYIAGAKIRAGDEDAAAVTGQSQALYVKGDAYVEGGFTGGSLSTNGLIRGGSLNITGGATAGFFSTTGSIQGNSLNVTGGATAGSFSTTGPIQGNSLNVTGGATAGSLSSSIVYVKTISPYPPGSTGIIDISTSISITTPNPTTNTKSTSLNIGQTDIAGNSNVTAYLVGDNPDGFGNTDNDKESFRWYAYPKNSYGGLIYLVESTPLKAGTTGPAGVAGAIGDKYFYGSVQAAGGFYGTTGSLTSLKVSQQAEILNIYTDKISPYPIGSTGKLIINGGALITNDNTDNSADAAEITFKTTQTSTERSAAFTCVGSTGVGYGGTSNDTEQFCLYTIPSIPNGNVRTKVESTPLRAGTTGPLGITGAIGDKYFYGSVQVGGTVYGNTGSFQNMTVNGLLTMNGSFVYGVQVI
jgi:hypothetical protein